MRVLGLPTPLESVHGAKEPASSLPNGLPPRRRPHPVLLPPLPLLSSRPFLLLGCRPEPHILLFRRELGTDPTTGLVDPELKAKAVRDYQKEFGLAK